MPGHETVAMAVTTRLPRRRTRPLVAQRRNLIGHQLLNLVHPGHRQRVRQFGIRRGRTHTETRARPFDHRIFVLLFDPPVHDRIPVRQFQFAYFAVPIDLAPRFQLRGREGP
jgi:hypothetical protein